MPTNNFKLFDENKVNILTDTEYNTSSQRLNGVQTGVASSQLNNKFAYQVSLVAYAIAQIMNANGQDASDTLAVSAFVGNLQGTLLQKVADKATTAEAAAGVISNKYITPETMKAAALLLSGGVMSGMLDMGGNRITNLGTPTADSDAITKAYADSKGVKISTYTGNGKYGGDSTPYTTKISIEEGTKFVIIYGINDKSLCLYSVGEAEGVTVFKDKIYSESFVSNVSFEVSGNTIKCSNSVNASYQFNGINIKYIVAMFF